MGQGQGQGTHLQMYLWLPRRKAWREEQLDDGAGRGLLACVACLDSWAELNSGRHKAKVAIVGKLAITASVTRAQLSRHRQDVIYVNVNAV